MHLLVMAGFPGSGKIDDRKIPTPVGK